MKKTIFFLMMFATICQISAQVTPTEWYFGYNSCLHFNSNGSTEASTVGIGNTLIVYEGTSIVCDKSGNVVFYAGGTQLCDANGMISTIWGDGSATQAHLAVPISGNFGQNEFHFLLFSLKAQEDWELNNCLSVCFVKVIANPGNPTTYSVIPDPLGPGWITTIRMSEKLAFISDGESLPGYWVLAHDYHNDILSYYNDATTFYKYHITANLFSSVNSTSSAITVLNNASCFSMQSIGANHANHGTRSENAQGQMKFNKNGDRLGLVIAGSHYIEIFPFSKNSGILGSPIFSMVASLQNDGYLYGFEFAPNSENIFYTAEGQIIVPPPSNPSRHITQWILNPPNASYVNIATETGIMGYAFDALQLGPNDKIYCTHGRQVDKLSVINSPDLPGLSCLYQDNVVKVCNWALYGLPSYVTINSENYNPPQPTLCQCSSPTIAGNIVIQDPTTGMATVSLTLNSGSLIPSAVTIEFSNFDIVPNGSDCRNYCDMPTLNMGMFTNQVPEINTSKGILIPLQPGITTNQSHAIAWNLSTNTQPLFKQTILLNLRLPLLYGLQCCQAHYSATIHVSYYDNNCHVCQSLLYIQSIP